jgi:single-strand DNA-binding protein
MSTTDNADSRRWQDDINVSIFSGELVRNPELYRTPDGLAVANLRVASADTRMNGTTPVKHTTYVDVKVFERDAERCCEHLRRGSPVTVQGKLDYYEWTDHDGSKRSGLRVLAHDVRFTTGHRPFSNHDRRHPRASRSAATTAPAESRAGSRDDGFAF